jgi:hypothetical protein
MDKGAVSGEQLRLSARSTAHSYLLSKQKARNRKGQPPSLISYPKKGHPPQPQGTAPIPYLLSKKRAVPRNHEGHPPQQKGPLPASPRIAPITPNIICANPRNLRTLYPDKKTGGHPL